MKCYVFVHDHLSDIQKGIQAAHAVADLVRIGDETVREWVREHKTLLFCRGGNTEYLTGILKWVRKSDYQYAYFVEDWPTLDSMLTAVVILDSAPEYNKTNDSFANSWVENLLLDARLV